MINFITSATHKENYPLTNKEIVFVGRSNVGKSSLINALYGKVAYVGKTPGKTRLLNFFSVDNKYTICDVPGYGYARRSDKELIDYGKMMEEYFSSRKELKLCIVILDIRRIPNEDDLDMLSYLDSIGLKTLVVLNKADKLSNNQINKQVLMIKKTLESEYDYLITSTLNKKNIVELKNRIES